MPEATIDPAVVAEAKKAFDATLREVRAECGEIEKRLNAELTDLKQLRAEDLEKHDKMTADLEAAKTRHDELEVSLQKAVAARNASEENKDAKDGWHKFATRHNLHHNPGVIKNAGIEGEVVAAYTHYSSAFAKAMKLSPDAGMYIAKNMHYDKGASNKYEWNDDEKKAVQAFAIISKAITGATDASGGLLLPEIEEQQLERQLWLVNPIRQECSVVSIGAQAYERNFMRGDAGSGWVGETTARPETSTPNFVKVTITPGEIYAAPEVSRNNIDDARYDVAAIVIEEVARVFGVREATAFTNGDGANKPDGLLMATTTTGETDEARELSEFDRTERATGTAQANLITDSISLYKKLKREYRHNSKWFMNRGTASDLYGLKGTDGHYILQPVANSLQFKLFGYPIVEIDEFPDYDTVGAKYIAFGDMKRAYQIVDRQSMDVLIDPYSSKPMVIYYCTRRVGGAPVDGASLKFLQATA